jgi:uncharacterized repeat protein (TIGR03803 family)
MKKAFAVLVLSLLLLFSFQTRGFAALTLVHEFNGNDGSSPNGDLVFLNGMVYGMTVKGGPGDLGVIFGMKANGAGYQILHEFAGGVDDGASPFFSLATDGAALYGATRGGGDSDAGVLFRINPDGTGFQLLHEFAGGDGAVPYGTFLISGSTLYGMTRGGGASGVGVIFKIGTNGSGYALLHEFAGGADDGAAPYGTLVTDGPALYGTADGGGDSNLGVVFKINPDGTGFQLLHEFTGADGSEANGALVIEGSTLYGTTFGGGSGNSGVVFKVNKDGTGYQVLHTFTGGPGDGAVPYAPLTGGFAALYGTTIGGGSSDGGIVFEINRDGTGYQVLHEFAGGANDGEAPFEALTYRGSNLYGTTESGGNSDAGVVFVLSLPVPKVVPALSDWGVVILVTLLMIAGLVVRGRRTEKTV